MPRRAGYAGRLIARDWPPTEASRGARTRWVSGSLRSSGRLPTDSVSPATSPSASATLLLPADPDPRGITRPIRLPMPTTHPHGRQRSRISGSAGGVHDSMASGRRSTARDSARQSHRRWVGRRLSRLPRTQPGPTNRTPGGTSFLTIAAAVACRSVLLLRGSVLSNGSPCPPRVEKGGFVRKLASALPLVAAMSIGSGATTLAANALNQTDDSTGKTLLTDCPGIESSTVTGGYAHAIISRTTGSNGGRHLNIRINSEGIEAVGDVTGALRRQLPCGGDREPALQRGREPSRPPPRHAPPTSGVPASVPPRAALTRAAGRRGAGSR